MFFPIDSGLIAQGLSPVHHLLPLVVPEWADAELSANSGPPACPDNQIQRLFPLAPRALGQLHALREQEHAFQTALAQGDMRQLRHDLESACRLQGEARQLFEQLMAEGKQGMLSVSYAAERAALVQWIDRLLSEIRAGQGLLPDRDTGFRPTHALWTLRRAYRKLIPSKAPFHEWIFADPFSAADLWSALDGSPAAKKARFDLLCTGRACATDQEIRNLARYMAMKSPTFDAREWIVLTEATGHVARFSTKLSSDFTHFEQAGDGRDPLQLFTAFLAAQGVGDEHTEICVALG